MIFYSHTNKLQFNEKGFELGLVSKVRVFWNSEMANCVLTERVKRVVVLNKLNFEWRTGTEHEKSTSQKTEKKTRKRSRIVCHYLRKAGLPGLQGSRLALADSQNPSGFPKLPVKR